MTDPTRGARLRRGARRPGWVMVTVLLVLAIGASSALVFTNRAELLKLAVLLALWAAVVAAFASVIYRRQSDSDQAKVRDLKFVYDLQLEREISARREYELQVETQLRRELAAELRSRSADEVSTLRAELAALRANLEYLFDTDLSHRHAIETDRPPAQAYGEWTSGPAGAAGRVSVSRIDAEEVEDARDDRAHGSDTDESPIIDVPAEPHPPEAEQVMPPQLGGAHRRSSHDVAASAHPERESAGRRSAPPRHDPPPPRSAPPPPPPEPLYPWLPPPTPEPHAAEPAEPAGAHWRSAPARGEWIPPGAPSGHRAPSASGHDASHRRADPADHPDDHDGYVGRRRAPEDRPRQPVVPLSPPLPDPPRGRHDAPPAAPRVPAPPPAQPDGSEDADGGAHTGGQSVAELMARLQATPSGGGRRRRRED